MNRAALSISLAALALTVAPATQAAPLPLRVLTFNAWAVPWISDEREARVHRIGQAVAELHPDLVALQEVWTVEDADAISATLIAAGLRHVQAFASSAPVGSGGAGLLIASVYPLDDIAFKPFSLGARPHTPWHLDWIAVKGVARAHVATPLGKLTFATTHLQASYGTGNYVPVRIGQILQIIELLAPRSGLDPLPAILVGDLNATSTDLEVRLLEASARLQPAAPDFDIDSVHYRSGKSLTLRPVHVTTVLDQPVELGNGSVCRLSDHPGIVVDFELSTCEACDAISPSEGEREVTAAALAVMEAEKTLCEGQARWSLRLGVAALPLSLGCVALARRRTMGRRRGWMALGTALLVGAMWLSYFALGYAPPHLAGLEEACREISR